jgi:DNA-binding CsgD family transcriptional regulator
LNISANTVKRHVYNLFQKTGVNNRVRMINAVQEFRE